MPFFFDLSSLIPTIERNPFEPVIVTDETPAEPEQAAAEPLVDTGLPIPAHYDIDLMRAIVQDPFHLFVHWQLKGNPFDRLRRIFPTADVNSFQTVLKLIDETNRISVYFDAAFAREYWFTVFPDRTYRVELGVRSPQHGYIKLLTSATVRTPRGAPSDQTDDTLEYQVTANDYLRVLRESHLVPERAFTPEFLVPGLSGDTVTEEARASVWNSLPDSFRRLLQVIADIQAGRDYDRLWERLSQEELTSLVREFLATIQRFGGGELGYMLLLRYLPELLRRTLVSAEQTASAAAVEIEIDKPITLYLAERLGQAASEQTAGQAPHERPAPSDISHGQWLPSMKR